MKSHRLHDLLLLAFIAFAFAISTGWCASPGIETLPKPWNIAHRGGMLLWPEHSMRAFMASTAWGNHFVEVDCMLLADGELVISHSDYITDERGEKQEIAKLTQLDWLRHQMTAPRETGRPLLNDVLRHFGNRKILFLP
jgi:glycerophosphoryl diester phosphodiesterase